MGISLAEAADGGEETQRDVRRITQKLQAQTVLVGKWTDEERAQDRDKVIASRPGSGILVHSGRSSGILTAGHVVRNLRPGESSAGEVVMAIGQGMNPMSTGPQKYRMKEVRGWIVAGEGMCTSRKDPIEAQLRGPDIAWIRITPVDASDLKAYPGGIFHNWRKAEASRSGKTRAQGYQEEGLWMCGGIYEKSERLLEVGQVRACVAAQQVFRVASASEPDDGWDRFDYTLRLAGHPKARLADWWKAGRSAAENEILREEPESWRGMSGAGIWEARRTPADEGPVCSLVGVVYAEHPPNLNEPELKLRAHGIGSINRILSCE